MKIGGDEPFFGLKSLCKNVWNTWNWWRVTQNLTMNDIWFGDIFSEINLDSSIIYVIILTNLIYKTKIFEFGQKKNLAEINNNF